MPEKFSPQPDSTKQSFSERLGLPNKESLRRWILENPEGKPYNPLLERCKGWVRKISLAMPLYFAVSGSTPAEAGEKAEQNQDYATVDSLAYDLNEIRHEAKKYQSLLEIDWLHEDICRNYEEVLKNMGYARYYKDYRGKVDENGTSNNSQVINKFPQPLKDYENECGYALTVWYANKEGHNQPRDQKFPGIVIGKKFDSKNKTIIEIIYAVDTHGKLNYIRSLKTNLPNWQEPDHISMVRQPFYISDEEIDPMLYTGDIDQIDPNDVLPDTEEFEEDNKHFMQLISDYSLELDDQGKDARMLLKDIKDVGEIKRHPIDTKLQTGLDAERREKITQEVYYDVKIKFEEAFQRLSKNNALQQLLGKEKFIQLTEWLREAIDSGKILIPYKTAIEDLRINPSQFKGRRARNILFCTKGQLEKYYGKSDEYPLAASGSMNEYMLMNMEELTVEGDRDLDEVLATLLHEIGHEVTITIPEEGGYHAWEAEEELPNWLMEGMNEAYTLFGIHKHLDKDFGPVRAGYSGGPTSSAILLCLASGSPTAVLRDFAAGRMEMTRILYDQKYGQGTFDRLTGDLIDDSYYSPNLLESRLVQLVAKSGGDVEELFKNSQEIFPRTGEGFLALADKESGSSVFADFHSKTQNEYDRSLASRKKNLGEDSTIDANDFISIYAHKEIEIGGQKYPIFFQTRFQNVLVKTSEDELVSHEHEDNIYSFDADDLKKFIKNMEETKRIFYEHYQNTEVAEKEFRDHLDFVTRLPQNIKMLSIELTPPKQEATEFINNQALCEQEARLSAERALALLKNFKI